jgi:uncharacterized spore protein YtfJ
MSKQELLSRVAENVSVRRAFGAAYEKDGLLIIPVALVFGGGGAGEGPIPPPSSLPSGADPAEAAEGGTRMPDWRQPTGSGAGFGGLIMPLGVYVVKDDKVRWIPVVDVTLIVLASLGVVRLLAGLRTHARRHQHGR